MTYAFVFPGQGSQIVSMAKDFYENFSSARDVIHEVDEVLAPLYGTKLSTVMFEGPLDTLTDTRYTQPALMAASMAIYRTFEHEWGKPLHKQTSLMAGHSLGEYTALCAANVLSLKDTASLLFWRGKVMAECAPQAHNENAGAMAAILGLSCELLEEITKNAGCYIANDNGGGQVVISGTANTVQKAMKMAEENGAKRAILLNVSAPFHCPLMEKAAEVMKEKIYETLFNDAKTPVVTNISAAPQTEKGKFQADLVEQICGRVRWRETMERMASSGVAHVLEVGPGKVLSNLCKRISPNITATALNYVTDLDGVLRNFEAALPRRT